MNLLSYVENPFKADAKFDFDKFRDHVGKAMHMMDDIIDLELEKVELIIKKIEDDPGKPQYILTRRGVGYYFAG